MCFFFKLNDGFCIFYVLSDIIFVGSLFFVQCNWEAPTALEATGEHVFGAETWLHPEIQCFFSELDFKRRCRLMHCKNSLKTQNIDLECYMWFNFSRAAKTVPNNVKRHDIPLFSIH